MKGMAFFLGKQVFGVCTNVADKIGVATSSVRMFFIYASFLTLGSPIILYLILAFVINIKKHLRRRNSIWDF